MTRPGNDIEFLDADGPARLGDDEITDARGTPRWVIGLGVIALVAIVAAALVAGRGSHHSNATRPTAPAPTIEPALPHPPVAGLVTGDSVRLPGQGSAVDIAVAGNVLYVLQADRITAVDPHDQAVIRSVPLGLSFKAGRDRLYVDAAHRRMWIVRTGDGASVSSVDFATISSVDTTSVRGDIARATVLDGQLFFSTSDGVYAYDGSTVTRVHAFGAAVALAADPTRHRLIALESGRPAGRLVAFSPTGADLASSPTDVVGGNVAVVRSTIYLTGADAAGAVVRAVDPVSLRPGTNLPIAVQLSPGANIAAVGTDSIWLRSSGHNRDVLWCHDVTGGPLAFWWTLTGTISSNRGAAFSLDDVGAVQPVDLISGCSG